VSMFCCLAAETNRFPGVRTKFASEARLSASELTTVIELAKRCGLPDATEVSTYNNYHPSPFFSIAVKGREVARGRRVTFITLQMDREKWTSKELRRSSHVVKSIGEFWVARGGLTTNVLTTFAIAGTTIRLRVADAIPLPTAERIVQAFATGSVRYADQKTRDALKDIDISQADGLDRNKEHFAIKFSPSQWTILWASLRVDTDGVTVVSVSKVVS
jgi:hypothetical protein